MPSDARDRSGPRINSGVTMKGGVLSNPVSVIAMPADTLSLIYRRI